MKSELKTQENMYEKTKKQSCDSKMGLTFLNSVNNLSAMLGSIFFGLLCSYCSIIVVVQILFSLLIEHDLQWIL